MERVDLEDFPQQVELSQTHDDGPARNAHISLHSDAAPKLAAPCFDLEVIATPRKEFLPDDQLMFTSVCPVEGWRIHGMRFIECLETSLCTPSLFASVL